MTTLYLAARPAQMWALTVLVFLAQAGEAQVIPLDDAGERLAIASRVDYYEDPSESVTIEDVLAPGFAANFVPHDRDILHFGLTSSAYWIRFTLDWSRVTPGSTRILEFGPPKHVTGLRRGGIRVYPVAADGTVQSETILGSQLDERELKTLNRGFALRIDPSFGKAVYVRVASARPLRMPLTIWQEDSFHRQAMTSDTLQGLQYGILLALIFYNLFLFLTVRESSYLFYVAAMAVQTAFIFLDSKHLRYMLDQLYRAGWGVDMAERLIYPLLVITTLLFQRSLLRIWERNPRLDKVVLWVIGSFGLLILTALLPNEKLFQYLFIALMLFTIPFIFYTNVDAIKRGSTSAVIHMAAMSVFLLGTIVLMLLQLIPDFPDVAFTRNAYDGGLIAQALLLSLSLSFRYNQIKQEKEDAQRLAIDNLVRSEHIKDDLLANVSHELRTPLYGINGLAETALREFRGERLDAALVTRNLELIQASGQRLTKLVNDLLDFSAAREEATYVKFKPVDLTSVATLVISVCKPLVGDKHIALRTEIEPDLPLVAGDEDRLQQILVNLTSNAIKFTYSGEVVIAAGLSSGGRVIVQVKDTGIGIHHTDHDTVFQAFEKLSSPQLNAGGIGLGLSLARRLVEMHRSELKLESELDVGSTFSFELRVSRDQTRAVGSPETGQQMIRRADYPAGSGRPEAPLERHGEQEATILVVDDDEINRVVMEQQLHAYHVITCSNGLDALNAVANGKPDLILLDLMMPGLNGYEVCQKLRRKYSQIELPIILVTAKNHLEDLAEGFQTGANDYLAKPFHNEELISRVENQLRLSMLHRVSEENIRLRSQIEIYAQADAELRGSRFRLQQILESIDAGFIAFELPGRIFSLNQRAAELLGTDRETLIGTELASILADRESNRPFRDILGYWESGELEEAAAEGSDSDSSVTSNLTVEVTHPYHPGGESTGHTISLNTRLHLLGSDEGTGILFLEETEPLQIAGDRRAVNDTAQLVGLLAQAQQNIRRIGTRLSVMTPAEVADYPALIDKLSGIDELVKFVDEKLPAVSSEGEYRQQLVTLMQSALHTWEITTQKSKIDLAEESNIWAVSIDDGRLRTRTFDRYLRLENLPKIPRWREVVRTAYFVLSNPAIEPETRASLEKELEKTRAILKKAAISQ